MTTASGRRGTRSTRQQTNSDVFYAIRDIVAEERRKGKLYYKIDWEDDPRTGESYEPTWEPAENATREAVADWERFKKTRDQDSDPESQPVRTPNWRAKRRRSAQASATHGRAAERGKADYQSDTSEAGDDSPEWRFVDAIPRGRGQLIVGIPHRPSFDTSVYVLVDPDELSEFNQDKEDGKGAISQTTIPDSQALSDLSLLPSAQDPGKSQHSNDVPAWVPGDPLQDDTSQTLDHSLSIRTDQILDLAEDGVIGDAQDPIRAESGPGIAQPSLDPLRSNHSTPQIPSRQPEPSNQLSEPEPQDLNSSPRFLTQEDLVFPLLEDSSSSAIQATALSALDSCPNIASQNIIVPASGSPVLSSLVTPFQEQATPFQQAAQVVDHPYAHPYAHRQEIRTQTQNWGGSDDECEVIPETVTRTVTRTFHPDEAPGELLDGAVIYSNSRASNGAGLLHLSLTGTASTVNQQPTLSLPRPVTGPSATMAAPPMEENPRSAIEELMDLRTSFFEQPQPRQSSQSPAEPYQPTTEPYHQPDAERYQPEEPLSAVEQLKRDIGLGIASADLPPPEFADLDYQRVPATVAPSDLTTSAEPLSIVDRSLPPSALGILPGITESVELEPSPQGDDEDERRLDQTEFIVTLPMAANSRDRYLRLIAERRATMIEFGDAFAKSLSIVPNDALVSEMDDLYRELLDICDLPSYAADIHDMSPSDMMRHATGTNTKFSFVYEFLNQIRDLNSRVLIMSRPGLTFEYLQAVLSASDFHYTVLGQGDGMMEVAAKGLSIILAQAGDDLTATGGGIDVVVVFDNVARSIELPASLGYDDIGPVVLSLVVTYSLEHIDRQLGQSLTGLERKNALNLAVVTARPFLASPEGGHPEPHELAEIFANFLKNPEGGLSWEPVILPDDVFDLYLSSQAENAENSDIGLHPDGSAQPNPRKRLLEDVDSSTAKRMKTLDLRPSSTYELPARMSDLLKTTLASYGPSDEVETEPVLVPLGRLESVATRMSELQDALSAHGQIETQLREHIKSLEAQIRSHERTTKVTHAKYMELLREQIANDKARKKAEEESAALKSQFDANRSEIQSSKDRIKALEAELAEIKAYLAGSSNPDAAKLAQAEKALEEAQAKVQTLEKKIVSVQGDAEYCRVAYQDASSGAAELGKENLEQKEKIKELERRASENLLKIHEINAKQAEEATLRQMEDMRAMLENRERELDRTREELQKLKNGRRETRQASIPRSPRTGVMSPRNGRGVGSGGSGSRGTSPAPAHDAASSAQQAGMTFLQQPGHRWRAQHPDD
ncbi:citron Rho-interacting kinase [Echria macrotheca]|uniref:Citron Rho-interacting kinase n=1 Tax=Echria macrotheca TaxID=438768 RepID=A0AAJ0FEZ2_9PEZI|nr:citron Rho-interacting kinase [Echria macrotheca]